jgi:hypothetical protein
MSGIKMVTWSPEIDRRRPTDDHSPEYFIYIKANDIMNIFLTLENDYNDLWIKNIHLVPNKFYPSEVIRIEPGPVVQGPIKPHDTFICSTKVTTINAQVATYGAYIVAEYEIALEYSYLGSSVGGLFEVQSD